MRSLQECQAEVFRRSENRIRQRKQRRVRIFAFCIPLVLCVGLLGVLYLPGRSGSPTTLETTTVCFSDVMDSNETVLFAGSVEVSGSGLSHVYTAGEDVQEIIRLLTLAASLPMESEDDAEETRDIATKGDSSAQLKEESLQKSYRILVTESDGTQAEYLLLGTLLLQESTQTVFHMDEDTCSALKAALGIPSH